MSNSIKLSNMQKKIGGGKALIKSSKYMDKNIKLAIEKLIIKLESTTEFQNLNFFHNDEIFLYDIVSELKEKIPNEDWFYNFDKSSLRPDGGILYIQTKNNNRFPILIAEMKKQGTNDEKITQTGKKTI